MRSFTWINTQVLAGTLKHLFGQRKTHEGRKQALATALLAALMLLASNVAAVVTFVEQVNVDSAQATPTYSTNPLTSGVTYRIEVSGVYSIGGGQQGDAEYTTADGFATHGDPGTPGDKDLLVVYGSSIGVPVFNATQNLTAQDVTWGAYNTTHVYSLQVVGDGGNIGFVISDYWGNSGSCTDNACVGDNSGILNVKIFINDDCLNSDLSATVVIDNCNSGVTNTLFATGCTIADLIAACAEGASTHGQFVSCVSALTNDLKKAGTISGQQKGAIQSCAAKAHIP